MSERISTNSMVLPVDQRQAIEGMATIRSLKQKLGIELRKVTDRAVSQGTSKGLQTKFEQDAHLVAKIIDGNPPDSKLERMQEIAQCLSQAAQTSLSNVAALCYARAAFLQQEVGLPYEEAFASAKNHLEYFERQGFPRTTPADFQPDAYILAIAKRAVMGTELPLPETVAQAIQSGDVNLLKSYALVLSEAEREQFIASFPQNQRAAISLQLDHAVSTVLRGDVIFDEIEYTQRSNVQKRVEEAFTQALSDLTSSPSNYIDDRPSSIEHVLERSQWIRRSHQLVEALMNLGEEDSLRLLKTLSDRTIRELKDANKLKIFKKKDLDERTQALKPFLSFTARVLDTLVEADIKRGGTLAMRYLEMSALPDRLFTFFARKLMQREYFTGKLADFLSRENIPVLKKLMSQYGPQFNTIIETLSHVDDYTNDHNLVKHEAEIFDALKDLSTLTPKVFHEYLDPRRSFEERQRFVQQINEARQKLFVNQPIREILPPELQHLLTEMVYLAYKPMGMSFDQVEKLIGQVGDHTRDLDRYSFPQEGYPLELEGQAKYVLKDRQQVDIATLKRYRSVLMPIPSTEQAENVSPVAQAFQKLLHTDQSPEREQTSRVNIDQLQALLLPLQGQRQIEEFLRRYRDVSEDNAYQMASELAEITGVYFRDNYSSLATAYLASKPHEIQQIATLLTDPTVRDMINTKYHAGKDWSAIDRSGPLTPAFIADLLKQIVLQEYMQLLQAQVHSELSKFTTSATDPRQSRGLRAYISKNVGSFFAKAAAGICTAEDIPLFEREDHFHINVVENNELVRANIQAYIAPVHGKPALVLRGFNPTPEWVAKVDIKSFCEQILGIGKQFAQVNGLDGVYITEQGTWHALSNRQQVAQYLTQTYEDGKHPTHFSLQVSSGHTVGTLYQIA